MYYLNLFFIYSVLGHLLEKILQPDRVSGIFYGYWTPVYGIGALIVILSLKYINKRFDLSRITRLIIVFLIGAVFLSSIEFLGGTLIEKIFHITFWNYEDMKFNIGKYASVEMGLIWGSASIILIYIIQPLIKEIAIRIPKWITHTLTILFITDIILTIVLKAK